MGSFRKIAHCTNWLRFADFATEPRRRFGSFRFVRLVMSPRTPKKKIQPPDTRRQSSPDGAGSYRICRRELRLPIPDRASCRGDENSHIGFVRKISRARRAPAQLIQFHFRFVWKISRAGCAPAQPIQLHFGFVRKISRAERATPRPIQLHFGFVRRNSRECGHCFARPLLTAYCRPPAAYCPVASFVAVHFSAGVLLHAPSLPPTAYCRPPTARWLRSADFVRVVVMSADLVARLRVASFVTFRIAEAYYGPSLNYFTTDN
jgi:hypothetical protein